jgi:hypothetical protein
MGTKRYTCVRHRFYAFELNKPYDLAIEVTNSVSYPYQNIWFFVQSNIDADSVFVDTSKEFLLADKLGKWQGSGFGTLYQSSLPFRRNHL